MSDKERIDALEQKVSDLLNTIEQMKRDMEPLKRIEFQGGQVISSTQNILIKPNP